MATSVAAPGPPLHNSVPVYQDASKSDLPVLDGESHDSSHTHAEQTNGTSSSVPRGPVKAEMNFYEPPQDGSPPHNFVEVPTDGTPQRNFGADPQNIQIKDLRGKESAFTLDRHAFAALQNHPHNPAIDWTDDESVKKHYYPEVEQILLKEIPGKPYKVLLFDHTIRRQDPEANRAPVTRAHIDQTSKSSRMRVEYHLPEKEAQEILNNNTRYRIINVWRPINGAVESFPLGFANSETVPDDDMVPVEHRYPDRTGETAAIRHNPNHEWYYWSGMDNNERILLQCFDSHNPNNRVPHSAFIDPRNTEQSKPRESIEVRALVFG